MTVRDLKEMLEGQDDSMEVHIAYNFGDYWRTQVAPKASDADTAMVKYSDYHRMDKIDEEDDDDNSREVFVIS
jgi:hypothetical protein